MEDELRRLEQQHERDVEEYRSAAVGTYAASLASCRRSRQADLRALLWCTETGLQSGCSGTSSACALLVTEW